MRLHLHDYSGHPFQVQLSRELAARGHEVLHSYSTQYVTGHGRLQVTPEDPDTLRIEGITCRRPLIKYAPVGRTRFELCYADTLLARLQREQFDLVVACNIPLFALDRLRARFARTGQPWVLWHQDIYSLGVGAEAARKLPGPLARPACKMVESVEKRQVRDAAAIVAITDVMLERYREWGIDREGVHVVPNWAPLDDIVPGERNNDWARRHDLPDSPLRLLYAGTLGRKHNPLLLLELLDAARNQGQDVMLVVASEGEGADQLSIAAAGRPDVRIVGYQPAEQFSAMLASADAVVALLEPDAAQFSVPSKVLSYLSAGRPIVGLVPPGNPAAADIGESGGFVAAPDSDGVRAAADWLAGVGSDRVRLAEIGRAARAMAVERFEIGSIADSFEKILLDAGGANTLVSGSPGAQR